MPSQERVNQVLGLLERLWKEKQLPLIHQIFTRTAIYREGAFWPQCHGITEIEKSFAEQLQHSGMFEFKLIHVVTQDEVCSAEWEIEYILNGADPPQWCYARIAATIEFEGDKIGFLLQVREIKTVPY